MNKLFTASLLSVAVLASYVNAEILTYTASSKKSQKEADQFALEGLAKQLRTKVSGEFETRMTEDAAGNVKSTAKSVKNTSTNMVLKGAKVVAGPKSGGKFQSTATIDTDQMASKILIDLESIRKEMKAKDSVIRLDMVDGDYRKMGIDMLALEKLADRYNENLEELSCVQKVPKNLMLESTIGELTEYLISGMASIKMETDLTSEALIVTVRDYNGPIVGFPLALTQDSKDIAHEKTNEEGEAVFSLAQVKKLHPSGDVTVLADLSFKYVRKSAVISQSVHYTSDVAACSYFLECDGPTEACGALRGHLIESGISISDNTSLPKMKAKITSADAMNSSKTLCTSRITLSLEAGTQSVTEAAKGVGRDAGIAQATAVKKVNATKLHQMFGKACK